MSDLHDQHQLNGYKFSFNRVNPYLEQLTPKNQSNHSKKQHKHRNSQIQQKNKHQINTAFKLASIKQRTQTVPTNNIIKDTKKIFYKNFNENQKNKMLIDLYLRKTKFNKIKLSNKITDHTQIKNKLNQINKNNLDVSDIVHNTNFSSTKDNYEENQENLNNCFINENKLQLQSDTKIKEINQKQLLKDWEKIKCESPKNKTNKLSNIKLIRNFSQSKFHPYLTSPKQNTKMRISTSGTTPIQTSNHSIKNLNQDKSINISSEKKKSKKRLHLQINTERYQSGYNFNSHDSDFIKVENVKNSQDTIRKNLGALKYKSPRVMLTCRNQKFMGRKQIPKIRLFTQQEEKNIIHEFYSIQKTQQSLQKH